MANHREVGDEQAVINIRNEIEKWKLLPSKVAALIQYVAEFDISLSHQSKCAYNQKAVTDFIAFTNHNAKETSSRIHAQGHLNNLMKWLEKPREPHAETNAITWVTCTPNEWETKLNNYLVKPYNSENTRLAAKSTLNAFYWWACKLGETGRRPYQALGRPS